MLEGTVLEKPIGNAAEHYRDLDRSRIYILPTRQGWLYMLTLGFILVGAINYNLSIGFAVCFLLFGLALIGILHTYYNLRGLILSSAPPSAIFVDEWAHFPVTIDNNHGNKRYALYLKPTKKTGLLNRKDNQQKWTTLPELEAGEQTIVSLPHKGYRRGKHRIGRIRIQSHFPLGLFFAWSHFTSQAIGIVYPKPLGDKLPLPRSPADHQSDTSTPTSGLDDFDGFRQYQPSDAIKNLAWKTLAQEQTPMVKQFSDHGTQKLLFSWAQLGDLTNTEDRLSQLCKWVLLADQQAIPYGLELPAKHIAPNSGIRHRENCLLALALFEQHGQ